MADPVLPSIASYPEHVAAWIKANVPGLRTSEAYGGQFGDDGTKRTTFQAPAFFVAVTGGTPQTPGTEQLDVELDAVGFVVALAEGASRAARERTSAALVEAIILKLQFANFDFTAKCGAGAQVKKFSSLYSEALDKQGVALWLIRWTHKVRIGESIWDGEGVVPTDVFVGQSPNVGAGNEADYEQVAGG